MDLIELRKYRTLSLFDWFSRNGHTIPGKTVIEIKREKLPLELQRVVDKRDNFTEAFFELGNFNQNLSLKDFLFSEERYQVLLKGICDHHKELVQIPKVLLTSPRRSLGQLVEDKIKHLRSRVVLALLLNLLVSTTVFFSYGLGWAFVSYLLFPIIFFQLVGFVTIRKLYIQLSKEKEVRRVYGRRVIEEAKILDGVFQEGLQLLRTRR